MLLLPKIPLFFSLPGDTCRGREEGREDRERGKGSVGCSVFPEFLPLFLVFIISGDSDISVGDLSTVVGSLAEFVIFCLFLEALLLLVMEDVAEEEEGGDRDLIVI